jgi:hypothetical protein
MSCTDKCKPTRKLREGEKRKKKREREKERKKKRERKRERKWTEWRVGSFTFAFGSVDIQSQLSKYEQTTITEAQKKAKTLFYVYRP